MALIKIYATPDKRSDLYSVAYPIKLIAAAALNVPETPTTPGSIETVYGEGVDLIGIDYIIEIIAVERPQQQAIADRFIAGLNDVYPGKLFSVYFNNIHEAGMAHTPRAGNNSASITMEQAIEMSKGRKAL